MTANRPVGVRWISWKPGDGYGDAAVQYLAALERLGVPLTWTPLEWSAGEAQPTPVTTYRGPLAHLVGRTTDHDTVVLHLVPDARERWLTEAAGRRKCLYTTWETDRVPDRVLAACDEFDVVLVPSTFNRASFLSSGCSTPVHVVPHCARRVPIVEPARFDRIGDRFAFYTVSTWSTRKAMADTVSAFLDAFDADDDVALVVKTSAVNQQAVGRARRGLALEGPARWRFETWPALATLLAGRRNVPEIYLIADHVPAQEIDALHARGDCFFSLTRSEGWGLCIADALLFGNPVVVTGWGGQLDYLGGDYPLLVGSDLVPTTSDPPDDWFETQKGHHWARARHNHAVELLRWVADHRDEAAAIGRRVGSRVAADYAPDKVGRQLVAALAPR